MPTQGRMMRLEREEEENSKRRVKEEKGEAVRSEAVSEVGGIGQEAKHPGPKTIILVLGREVWEWVRQEGGRNSEGVTPV